jgi:formate hydrogenlyase subunit 3/multisubunit Na+/H+ antiporter MnhD subunit
MSLSLLLLPLCLPAAAALVVLLIPRRVPWIREILSSLAAAASFAAALAIFILQPPDLRVPLLAIGGFSLDFDLTAPALSRFMLLFATGFGFLVSVYSLAFMSGRSRLREYYAFLLFSVAGASGVLLADHLLVFLVFWEIVTVSLYFLVGAGDQEAKHGATKSFAMLGGADGLLLMGIGLLWYLSRTFTLSAIRVPVEGWAAGAAFVLMMLGAITKAGAMPLHTWIPSASQGAPAPVMALLPAAVDKLLGIYLLLRISTGLFVLNSAMGMLLMIIGSVTIIAAVMVAMVQHDLRRLLSYHAISQVGYMVLGIGTLNPLGIAGGLFHMLNHSIYKSCLFLCAGAVEKKTGSTDLAELGGLARQMPVTFLSFLIAALAISGVPPLNGFVSKWFIYQGVIQSGNGASFVFLIVAMFGSALTLASFLKALYAVFLGQKSTRTMNVRGETSLAAAAPLVVLAALCVVFGVFYVLPLRMFIYPGTGVTASPPGVWQSGLATILIVGGVLLGLLISAVAGMARNVRTAPTFIGGERADPERIRVSGIHFYDTIRSMPLLSKIYAAQEKGRLDPYGGVGWLGLRISGALKRLHNGLLPWYLSWSVAGVVILICVFVFVR